MQDDISGMTQQSEVQTTQESKSMHPVVVFFHMFFKGLSIFAYLFLSMFTDYIIAFIVCIVALAFDFYTVKNISGRKLVGLRWWNEILEDGSSRWIFESRPNFTPSKHDSFMFWSVTYAMPFVWVLLGILLSGFDLKWILVAVIAVVMNFANLIGYWKCQKDASAKLKSYVGQQVVNMAMSNQL